MVGAYFKQLIAEGVPEWEAMRLTLAFQRRLLFADADVDPMDDDADV